MINNEILLIFSIFFTYGLVLLWFYIFGEKGLICFTVFATITANIEVILVIDAFNLEQTLGNILFASTFLVTDILSEIYGKKSSKKAVYVGLITSVSFIILSKTWLLYSPKFYDEIFESFGTLFSHTPRIMIASISVYAISQIFDVYIYHKFWEFTKKLSGNSQKFLWVRNNFSTLISQILNSFLFTVFAFYGIYDFDTLKNIFISSYVIFIITSLADTPVIYLARYIHKKRKVKINGNIK